jgi:hypothetical protein
MELSVGGIPFEPEKSVPVRYRDKILCHQRLDLLVGGRLILELKAIDRLDLRLRLLVNFNVPIPKYGIRRVIL